METKEQCEKRYGKAVYIDGNARLYEKAGLLIEVNFLNNVAHRIFYSKIKKDKIGKPLKLSDNEVKLLLESNKGSLAWKAIKANPIESFWVSNNGKIFASHEKFRGDLSVTTKEYLSFKAEEQKKEEAEKLKGL